ncbi:MAG: phosphate acyltransferase PlsX [Clostridia bacterium]|nr:phosphate acyltransferase PlsX [Clostridia bacterium]
MRIIVDIMSGDKAPDAQLIGALEAAREHPTVGFLLVGNKLVIVERAGALGLDFALPNVQIIHSSSVISMEDPALSVVREKRDSSMALGLHALVTGEGDAFISAGNTGALHAGSTLIIRRIKGVLKSAIATVLPLANPTLLIDSGANIEILPPVYRQFAEMGSVYMKRVHGVANPRVGLLNIGAERTKGTKIMQEAYELLETDESINFIGNVEGRDVPFGACDVLVCDGLNGNILLKFTEGCGEFMMKTFRSVFDGNPAAQLTGLTVRNKIRRFAKEFDYTEYGGAPLLGLSKIVIKAHGESDSNAIRNAVRQALLCLENRVNYEIANLVVPGFAAENAEDKQ